MDNIKKFLQDFWNDESGQTTTEYILILAAVVILAKNFSSSLKGIVGKLTTTIDTNSNQVLTQEFQ